MFSAILITAWSAVFQTGWQLAVGIAALCSVWAYKRLVHPYKFWKNLNVPHKPSGLLMSWRGAHKEQTDIYKFGDELYYDQNGRNYCGYYELSAPILFVGNPNLIRKILVKDFDHFADRPVNYSSDEIISNTLTFTTGDAWRELRAVMTPAFTSSKMRSVAPLVQPVVKDFAKYLIEETESGKEVDLSDACGRFSIDVIASVAFGIETNSFGKEMSEFYKIIQRWGAPSSVEKLKFKIKKLFPTIGWLLKLRYQGGVTDYFKNVVKEVIRLRETGEVERADLIQQLLRVRDLTCLKQNEAKGNLEADLPSHMQQLSQEQKTLSLPKSFEMTDIKVASQSILFLLTGFETIQTTLTFLLWLLSKNKEAQTQARKEVQDAIAKHGTLNYDALSDLTFIDACVSESMRMFPASHNTERVCTRDYRMDDGTIIPRGVRVNIPIWQLHHDERFWPDAGSFKPERFLPENKAEVTPYTFMPFGAGPRSCLGMRIAMLQLRLAVANLLATVELRPAPGAPEHVELLTDFLVCIPKQPLLVHAKQLQQNT